MAFQLTKAEIKQRDEIAVSLDTAGTTLTEAIDTFNSAVTEAWKDVQEAEKAYNTEIQAAQEFANEIHTARDDDFEEKSEKWKESDAGRSASDWLQEWDVEFDEIKLDDPDEIEPPDIDAMETLEGLPEGLSEEA